MLDVLAEKIYYAQPTYRVDGKVLPFFLAPRDKLENSYRAAMLLMPVVEKIIEAERADALREAAWRQDIPDRGDVRQVRSWLQDIAHRESEG